MGYSSSRKASTVLLYSIFPDDRCKMEDCMRGINALKWMRNQPEYHGEGE
jgi:hypothetical protein